MAGYKKIRDLATLTTITPDHIVPVASPLGSSNEITAHTTASNFFGSVINNSSTFQLDSNGNLEIKPGGIKAEDLSDESVGSEKLKTSGPGSIDVQNMVRKNVIIHVGNYQRNGVKYWASDAFNYADPVYGARTTDVVQFAGNSNHPDPYFGYYVAGSSDEVIEPFATVCAGARYVLHNHGSDASAVFLIHGHVAWCGQYDQLGTYQIQDVGNWTPFLNVGITAGVNPDNPGNGTDYLNSYADSEGGAARIDVDHRGNAGGLSPGFWFRAPTMYISGINFVFHNCPDTVSPNFSGGKGAGGFHELRGNKLQMVGGNHFTPYRISTDFFFSSGVYQPHEIHTTTANMTPFSISGMGTYGIYSNNSTTNGLYLSSEKAMCHARLAACSQGARFIFKMSQVYSKSGSTFDNTINSLGQASGYSSMIVQGTNLTNTADGHEPGGGSATWLPGAGHTDYGDQAGNTGTQYKAAGYYWNSVGGTTSGTTTSPTRGSSAHWLENRMTGYQYLVGGWSSKASLAPATIAGYNNLKSSPASRVGAGSTDSSFAPYNDQ